MGSNPTPSAKTPINHLTLFIVSYGKSACAQSNAQTNRFDDTDTIGRIATLIALVAFNRRLKSGPKRPIDYHFCPEPNAPYPAFHRGAIGIISG